VANIGNDSAADERGYTLIGDGEGLIMVELKAAWQREDCHLAQGLNDLKATGLKLALILNFDKPELEIKRLANNL
jgi:GxxExxY protein